MRPSALLLVLLVLGVPGESAAGQAVRTAPAGASLLAAARSGDSAGVAALIARRADVKTHDADGATALHWAVHNADRRSIAALIAAGAPVDAANDYGVTPLMLAIENRDAASVEALLKAGAPPRTALPTGETAVMMAAKVGEPAVLTRLLAAGADVNAHEQTRGQTALMWAVAEGHTPVVKLLIEAGADVRARSATGYTPLTFAARDGRLDLAEALVAAGADVNAAADDGMSVLHVATVRGQVAFAEYLLAKGANPNAAGSGFTPLHWAVGRWETITTKDYQVGRPEWQVWSGIPAASKIAFVTLLIDKGADVNARATKSPPRLGFGKSPRVMGTSAEIGATPYIFAAMGAEAEIMRLLVSRGADPKLASNDGTTALIMAAGVNYAPAEHGVPEARFFEAAKVAVEFGAEIDAANSAGNTALHATAWSGFLSVTKLLVERGAKLDLKNKTGETPRRVAEGTLLVMQVWFQPEVAAFLRTHDAPR